jgi:hypothetical protein
MKRFVKYFAITFTAQGLLIGFVFLTAFIFGTAIGDGILFLLYALPRMIILAHVPAEPSNVTICLGVLILGVLYSLLISSGIWLVLGRNRKVVYG